MSHDHLPSRPGQHILPEPGREVAIVLLDHGNRGAHLPSQRVNVHAVIEQSQRGIGVTQAVQGALLASARTLQQTQIRQ